VWIFIVIGELKIEIILKNEIANMKWKKNMYNSFYNYMDNEIIM